MPYHRSMSGTLSNQSHTTNDPGCPKNTTSLRCFNGMIKLKRTGSCSYMYSRAVCVVHYLKWSCISHCMAPSKSELTPGENMSKVFLYRTYAMPRNTCIFRPITKTTTFLCVLASTTDFKI